MDGTKYTYGGGLVRSLESRMLRADQISRMVDAPDFETAFSILNESGYARLLDKLSSPFDYEHLLHMELKNVKKLTNWAAPDSEILRSIWLKYDFQKIKQTLKANFSDLSAVTADLFERFRPFRHQIELAIKRFNEKKDPQVIDLVLDKAYLTHQKKVADSAGVPLFTKYVKAKIDTANIKMLLRAKEASLPKESITEVVPGGAIDEKRILDYFDISLEEIVQRLRYTDYAQALSEGIRQYSKTRSFHILERLLTGHALKIIKEAKHITFGIEPMLGFVLAKENEIKTLRMIFVSKISGVNPEILSERIPLYYV